MKSGVQFPPPLPDMPGHHSLFRAYVLWDAELGGEVLGTVTFFDPSHGGTWGVQLHQPPAGGTGPTTVWLYGGPSSKLGRWHVVREATHAADWLALQSERVAPYPAGTRAVPARIPGTAFFPGGSGLVKQRPSDAPPRFPVRGVMVVGQDFHSEEGYARSVKVGAERETDQSWRPLLDVLRRAGIDVDACFFTNAFMGLRTDGSIDGPFPGGRDDGFRERCRWLLGLQIAVQRPRLVLALGGQVPRMLAPLAGELAGWAHAENLPAIDAAGTAVVRDVAFHAAPDAPAQVVALTHPSRRHLNVGRRRYRGLEGDEAELAMLADAGADGRGGAAG